MADRQLCIFSCFLIVNDEKCVFSHDIAWAGYSSISVAEESNIETFLETMRIYSEFIANLTLYHYLLAFVV